MRRALFALAVLLVFFAATARAADIGHMRVLAGTTLVEDIVRDLAGPETTVRTIIPAAACPGHYDVKASDVVFAGEADLVALHDWQERMPAMVSLLEASGNAKAVVVVVKAGGNWMVPDRQKEAVLAFSRVLAQADPAHASDFAEKAERRLLRVDDAARRLRQTMRDRGLVGTPVMCDAMQRPFLEWLGFTVVAQYGRFEEMGPEALGKAMTQAKAGGARLVADNLQSTGDAGKALARDLGAAHVCLSNFPGGYSGADTWERAVDRNMEMIAAALAP